MSGNFLLNEKLEKYIYENGVNETKIEKEIREYNNKEHSKSAHLQISPEQSEFLKLIVNIGNYKNILEIGTYLGYSALSMALATKGKVTTIDKDEKTNEIALKFWKKAGVDHKIKLIGGLASEELDKLNEKYDFIFVDADKTNNVEYYEKCKNLLSERGVLAFDNMLWKGRVSEDTNDPKVEKIKAFNSYVKHDNYFEISLISIGDGIMLCKKRNSI